MDFNTESSDFDNLKRGVDFTQEPTTQITPELYQSPGLQAGNGTDRQAIELKFLVDLPLAERIRQRASEELALDPFSNQSSGTYGVSSYYLDTPERDIYHRTELLRGTKFRFRQYKDSPQIFLERKTRRQGVVSKQRFAVDLAELSSRNALSIPIWSEVSEFCLAPSCAVHYTRSAFVERTPSNPFRVTIDVKLQRYQFQTATYPNPTWAQLIDYLTEYNTLSNSGLTGKSVRHDLLPSMAVVEFKFMESLPKHLVRWLEEFQIGPVKFSKFRTAIAEYLAPQVAP